MGCDAQLAQIGEEETGMSAKDVRGEMSAGGIFRGGRWSGKLSWGCRRGTFGEKCPRVEFSREGAFGEKCPRVEFSGEGGGLGNCSGKLCARKCKNVRVNVRIPVHDYKSLLAAVMICTTLVNTHTHRHAESFRTAIILFQPAVQYALHPVFLSICPSVPCLP